MSLRFLGLKRLFKPKQTRCRYGVGDARPPVARVPFGGPVGGSLRPLRGPCGYAPPTGSSLNPRLQRSSRQRAAGAAPCAARRGGERDRERTHATAAACRRISPGLGVALLACKPAKPVL